VKHEGNWPKEDKKITIDISTATRTTRFLQVAKAVGWKRGDSRAARRESRRASTEGHAG